MDLIQPNFGIRVRKLRLDRGLSQSELAEMVELSEDQVSNIERGKSWVGEQTLALLSIALSVPQRSFFDYSENETFVMRGGLTARAPRKKPRFIVRRARPARVDRSTSK